MPDEPIERLRAALAGRYEIERAVGAGGMATVYLAHDLKHRRRVAIKVLAPDLAALLGAERFLREIEIVAGFNHPHIVPLYDSGVENGLLFYVMPYMEGQSLRDRLRREGQCAGAASAFPSTSTRRSRVRSRARGPTGSRRHGSSPTRSCCRLTRRRPAAARRARESLGASAWRRRWSGSRCSSG